MLLSRRMSSGAVVAVLGGATALGGCGASKALGELAAEQAGNLSHIAETRWVPRPIPPAELAVVSSAAVESQAQRLLRHVSGLSTDDAVEVVDSACELAGVIQATASPTAAATWFRDRGRSGWVYRQRATDLADELVQARTTADRALTLGAAAVCEAASEHST
jgi:hypothetical protein